jgi:hypothetical protein
VKSLGLKVDNAIFYNDGVTVNGGMTVHDEGLTVNGAFTTDQLGPINYGMRVTSKGMTSAKKILINDVGLDVIDGLSIQVDGLSSTGQVKVVGTGVIVTGGVSVRSGGINIFNDMLNVEDIGVFVLTNGMTISNHGLKIDAGLLSVEQTGLKITEGGLTLHINGLKVFSGADISKIYNHGVSDYSTQTFKSDEVTVQGYNVSGSVIHTAIQVENSGLLVTGGISFDNIGISVYGGLSVLDNGIVTSSLINTEGTNLSIYLSIYISLFMFRSISHYLQV